MKSASSAFGFLRRSPAPSKDSPKQTAPSVTVETPVIEPSVTIDGILIERKVKSQDISEMYEFLNNFAATVSEKFQKKQEIIDEQTLLSENEKFEEAEQLNSDLELVTANMRSEAKKLIEQVNKIQAMSSDLYHSDSQLKRLAETEINQLTEQISHFNEDAVNSRNVDLRNAINKKLLGIEDERGVIAGRLETVLNEEAVVASKKNDLINTVNAECAEMLPHREQLLQQETELKDEIDKLELLLKQKKEERLSVLAQVSEIDVQISAVNENYATEFNTIDTELCRLDSRKRELQIRDSLLLKEVENFHEQTESIQKQAKEEIQKFHQLRIHRDELLHQMQTDHIVESSLITKLNSFLEKAPEIQALRDAQDHLSSLVEDCSALKDLIIEKEMEITNTKSHISMLREKTGKLELDKKQAVVSRLFKEAKAISDEIKEFSDKIELSEAAITKTREEMNGCRAKLEQNNVTVDELISESIVKILETFKTRLNKFSRKQRTKLGEAAHSDLCHVLDVIAVSKNAAAADDDGDNSSEISSEGSSSEGLPSSALVNSDDTP
jgi:chromosome segregation ATPase